MVTYSYEQDGKPREMHVVVNRFTLQPSVDWMALTSELDQFQEEVSGANPAFRGASLVRVDDADAILLVFFDTREALDDISRNIAAPWFAEHVRPHLAGAVDRQVGEIVAGYMK